jgi:small subunit ribosomal protein S20
MAHSNSARKRIRQNEKHRIANRAVLGHFRNAIKEARDAIEQGTDNAAELVRNAESSLARAARKGVLKPKTASRRTARLVKALKA